MWWANGGEILSTVACLFVCLYLAPYLLEYDIYIYFKQLLQEHLNVFVTSKLVMISTQTQ